MDPNNDITMEEVINIPSDAEDEDEQASEEDPEEDGEEDAAEKELSMSFLCVLSCIDTYSFNGYRDPAEGVDCAHIRFFKVDPIIEYINGRRCHTFICGVTKCL